MALSPVILDFQEGLAPSQVRKLAFGEFSSALTFNGEVYIWGLNQIAQPRLVKAASKQSPNTSLAVSIPHTLFRDLKLNHHLLTALDVDNSLYHWSGDEEYTFK